MGMSEASKKRMEEVSKNFGTHYERIYKEGYQAGMQDPDANADIVAERETVIQYHLNHIKKLESQIDLFLESGKKRTLCWMSVKVCWFILKSSQMNQQMMCRKLRRP